METSHPFPAQARWHELLERGAVEAKRGPGEAWWVVKGPWCGVWDAPGTGGRFLGVLWSGAAFVAARGPPRRAARALASPRGVDDTGVPHASAGARGAWLRLSAAEAANWFLLGGGGDRGRRFDAGRASGEAWVSPRCVAAAPDPDALDAAAARFHPERRAAVAFMARHAYPTLLARGAREAARARARGGLVGAQHLRGASHRFCFSPSKRTWEQNISDACRCPQAAPRAGTTSPSNRLIPSTSGPLATSRWSLAQYPATFLERVSLRRRRSFRATTRRSRRRRRRGAAG